MRQIERNGIVIDLCVECRGIFLDRGELEHLLDNEQKAQGFAPEPVDMGKDDFKDKGKDKKRKKKSSKREGVLDWILDF